MVSTQLTGRNSSFLPESSILPDDNGTTNILPAFDGDESTLDMPPADARDRALVLAFWRARGVRPTWADRYEDPRAAAVRLERRVAALEALLEGGAL